MKSIISFITLLMVVTFIQGCATAGINNNQVDAFEKYGYQINHFSRTDFWGFDYDEYDIFAKDRMILKCGDTHCYNQWRLAVMMDLIRDKSTSQEERQALSLEYQDLRDQINNSNMVMQNFAANYMLQKMK